MQSHATADGGSERDALLRTNMGCKVWGAFKCVLSNRARSRNSVLYMAENWSIGCAERRKVNEFSWDEVLENFGSNETNG